MKRPKEPAPSEKDEPSVSEDAPPSPDQSSAPSPDEGGEAEGAAPGAEVSAPSGMEEAPPTREDLEALRQECGELRDLLLRRRADFENYRKRVERDRQEAGADAVASLLRELIPTLDNLERALVSGADESSLRKGVELTLRELGALLERHGVHVHDPTGQVFDPEAHQALLHEFVPGFEEGTVVEVFRKGYSFRERLLRPALVKVAKGDEPDAGPESGGVH